MRQLGFDMLTARRAGDKSSNLFVKTKLPQFLKVKDDLEYWKAMCLSEREENKLVSEKIELALERLESAKVTLRLFTDEKL